MLAHEQNAVCFPSEIILFDNYLNQSVFAHPIDFSIYYLYIYYPIDVYRSSNTFCIITIQTQHFTSSLTREVMLMKKQSKAKVEMPNPDFLYESYGSRIKELRIKSGLTQSAVAESLGVTPGYISNVENNRTAMSLRMLIYYARLTGVSLDALVGELEPDYEPTALDNKLLEKISALTDEQKKKLISMIEVIF